MRATTCISDILHPHLVLPPHLLATQKSLTNLISHYTSHSPFPNFPVERNALMANILSSTSTGNQASSTIPFTIIFT